MSILFVANQFKTPFFLEIARRVETAGEAVCWLTPSLKWNSLLEAAGVEGDRILCTAKFSAEWTSSPKPMTSAERSVFAGLEDDKHTLNTMLEVDRSMGRRPLAMRERHLAVLAREIPNFLDRQTVATAIGEYTWPIEQITALGCRARGAAYLTPATIRVPSDRFAFMVGGGESNIFSFREPIDIDHRAARDAIESVRAGAKPYYMTTGASFVQRVPHWVKEAVEALNPNGGSSGDSTVIPLSRRLSSRAMHLINRLGLAFSNPFDQPVPGEKFVLLTLHVQPEASIDTLARSYRDQVAGALSIARLLPADVRLYVKEHSAAVGDRPSGFYETLKSIPGARLIDPKINARYLMDDAELIIAPSGTICMEAALVGARATTFANLFFSPLLTIPNFDPYGSTPSEFRNLLERHVKPESDRLDALAHLIANSFPGRIDDPINYPGCMAPENLDRVAEAILTVKAHSGSPSPASVERPI